MSVPIDGREVIIRAYRLDLKGVGGYTVPVYFLDTDLPANDDDARKITERLYAGDPDHRIRQEAVLGIGGRRMLRAIGHDLGKFHMNEGHACFVCIELLSERISRTIERGSGVTTDQFGGLSERIVNDVRKLCVFTTHTPVAAGHDRFPIERVKSIIGDHPVFNRPDLYGDGETLNTTKLAMNFSSFVNAVARKHGEVSRKMFPGYPIQAITNGVHATTWTHPAVRDLFDEYCQNWRFENMDLRHAAGIPADKLMLAHTHAKRELIDLIGDRTGNRLDPEALTLVFSRRMTDYKRPTLALTDLERLAALHEKHPIQFVFAGKAHPHDGRGQEIIQTILAAAKQLEGKLPIVFLPSYEIEVSKTLVSGADVWLNNPRPPLEASGTSGMKAALNGVPSLSTMDGWWLEGCVEGVTGWSIGTEEGDAEYGSDLAAMDRAHTLGLYDRLEHDIAPLYHENKTGWADVMRSCIAMNGTFFTTERMVREYALRAYLA
ncbi:MAG: alpha-glucan family phosphorylase [Planctomycetota bacterium]